MEPSVLAADQCALFDSRAGAHGNRIPPCCEIQYAATQRVPFPEISASEPSALNNRARTSASFFWSGNEPLHAVGANPSVAVADAARERSHVGGRVQPFDDQEVIATSRGLREWNSAEHVALFPVPLAGADKLYRFYGLKRIHFSAGLCARSGCLPNRTGPESPHWSVRCRSSPTSCGRVRASG